MRFLITRISEAFKEVNLEEIETELRDCGLRARKEAIEVLPSAKFGMDYVLGVYCYNENQPPIFCLPQNN